MTSSSTRLMISPCSSAREGAILAIVIWRQSLQFHARRAVDSSCWFSSTLLQSKALARSTYSRRPGPDDGRGADRVGRQHRILQRNRIRVRWIVEHRSRFSLFYDDAPAHDDDPVRDVIGGRQIVGNVN